MKIPLLIGFFIAFLTACSIKRSVNRSLAQQTRLDNVWKTINGDTARYLKEIIIANKANYQHKPLNVLLENLPFEVKGMMFGTRFKDRSISPDITLLFSSFQQYTNTSETKPPLLIIQWEKPISKDSTAEVFLQSKGDWKPVQRKYFGKQIVGDIMQSGHGSK